MLRNRPYLLSALAVVPLAAVSALLWCGSPRKPVLPARGTLLHFLTAYHSAGLPYRVLHVARGERIGVEPGVYLKAAGETREWDELILSHQQSPGRARGYAVVRCHPGRGLEPALPGSVEEGRLYLRGFVLEGDPVLLRALVEAFD